MKKILLIISLLLPLDSCSLFYIHRIDVEQGNVITQDVANKLHKGMSKQQVEAILGAPILTNTFRNNRVTYVYTFQPANSKLTEKHITLIFQNGIVKDIKR